MNDEEATEDTNPEAAEKKTAESTKSDKRSEAPKRILLVPYPKFVFMYPTLIVATVAAIVLSIGGYSAVDAETQTLPVVMTGLFLAVMMANMFIIVFDFPRATSLTLLFIITTIGLGVWMMFVRDGAPDALPATEVAQPAEVVPAERGWLSSIRPAANATFFFCIVVGMCLMYIAVLISVRFNYWELRNNELLHHHGILSDLKRYPAPNLRIDKEINDVFEYMLLGAGRLILQPTTEKRAIVLDNVLFVGSKERDLTRMLGSIKVKIGADSGVN